MYEPNLARLMRPCQPHYLNIFSFMQDIFRYIHYIVPYVSLFNPTLYGSARPWAHPFAHRYGRQTEPACPAAYSDPPPQKKCPQKALNAVLSVFFCLHVSQAFEDTSLQKALLFVLMHSFSRNWSFLMSTRNQLRMYSLIADYLSALLWLKDDVILAPPFAMR